MSTDEREGKACWPGRVISAGTATDPHGFTLEILFGSTLPDVDHQKVADVCVEFVASITQLIKQKYPITEFNSKVLIANMTKDPDWEAPNVH